MQVRKPTFTKQTDVALLIVRLLIARSTTFKYYARSTTTRYPIYNSTVPTIVANSNSTKFISTTIMYYSTTIMYYSTSSTHLLYTAVHVLLQYERGIYKYNLQIQPTNTTYRYCTTHIYYLHLPAHIIIMPGNLRTESQYHDINNTFKYGKWQDPGGRSSLAVLNPIILNDRIDLFSTFMNLAPLISHPYSAISINIVPSEYQTIWQ